MANLMVTVSKEHLNLVKQHDSEEVDNLVTISNVETAEVTERVGSNVERVNSSLEGSEEGTEFWLPPEPEDEEDDIVGSISRYDDDDHDECGAGASFREEGKFKEEKLKAMNKVRNGRFTTLVSQLVKSVGVDSSTNYGKNWVDIVTSLSWEAAAFVKPDTQEGKTMDLDGYVKVKCIATGLCTQSHVIKGLVFKKHAAHKHMATNYENPRLLLIRGSLDLSTGGLSSFDSMQEKDNLKTIVEMIQNPHLNVILVEKSVSRDIQESILAKGMTLVFDMNLHRLERVARCIGSPILSIELAIHQKLRKCDSFHIEKFVEEHDVSAEGGKKPSKTLMFLEGCPSRLGCTILLMGANSDELKRIKCVIRCAVVMAYHLMLETSFLLDQSVMFSTISPSKLTFIGSDEANISSSDTETNTSFTLDTPTSINFQGNESKELTSLSGDNSSLSFQSYNPATFPGLPLSTSIQEVMNDSFPLSSDKNLLNTEQCRAELPETWKNNDSGEDHMHSKDEIRTVLDSESISVLMSSRNLSRGTICEQSHISHIKFYGSFDVPLGKFLHDNLLNQTIQCKTCGESPEVHIFYYAHHDKQLRIQVRHLHTTKSLPGETEGKLWMWSRCSQCKDGSSKSTKRVLISSAARGLSFGKFLELSFSNHSSFDSLSSCGHSFHKDFLYFFGLGPMVAMFKYSPVATYSVSLPPRKMESNASVKQEFIQKESDNVYLKGISMFLDIEKSLKEMETRYADVTLNIQGSSKEFSDIILMLKQEKSQFEVNAVKDESEVDAAFKLVSLNRIRLELLLESCIWDRRLHALLSSCDLKVIDTDLEKDKGWIWAPFTDIRRGYMEDLHRGYLPNFESFSSYTAESVSQKLINDEGSRLHIPLGTNDYIVSDYEDEFSSIIACALTLLKDLSMSAEHLDVDARKEKGVDPVFSLTSSSWTSFDSDSMNSSNTNLETSHSSSFDYLDLLDSLGSYSRPSHPQVSLCSGKFSAKKKYSVVCESFPPAARSVLSF